MCATHNAYLWLDFPPVRLGGKSGLPLLPREEAVVEEITLAVALRLGG